MTLELRNSQQGPGYALLVFDRTIDGDQLALSVLNLINRRYLGTSVPGKTNWTTARSHFFTASRVKSETGTVFQIGPEITSFLTEETIVEFATADDSVKERIPWRGILSFGWSEGPPAPAPAPEAERVADPVPVPHVATPSGPEAPIEFAPEPAPVAQTVPQPPRRNRAAFMLVPLLLLLSLGAYAASSSGGAQKVCQWFGMGCREVAMFASAQSCAADKTCGALTCTEEYRLSYPSGKFRQQISLIDAQKGKTCDRPAPAPSVWPTPDTRPPVAAPPATAGPASPSRQVVSTTALLHNGSRIEMRIIGTSQIEMRYKTPRAGLPVEEGALLFRGSIDELGVVSGTAYTFKRGCAPSGYSVSGRMTHDTVLLSGASPIHVQGSCEVARYDSQSNNARLEFKTVD